MQETKSTAPPETPKQNITALWQRRREMEENLLTSLESLGVSIPPGVTSIESTTPDSLYSICLQYLSIVDFSSSFPKSLPESTADRFKVWKNMTDVIRNRGYVDDINFQERFSNPSEEDYFDLVRYRMRKFVDSRAGVTDGEKSNVEDTSEYLKPKIELLYHSKTKGDGQVVDEFRENVNLNEEKIEDPLGVSTVNAYEKVESSSFTKTGCDIGNPQTKMILNEADVLTELDPCQSELGRES